MLLISSSAPPPSRSCWPLSTLQRAAAQWPPPPRRSLPPRAGRESSPQRSQEPAGPWSPRPPLALRDAPRRQAPERPRSEIRLVRTGTRPTGPSVRRHRRRPWDSFFMRVVGGSLLVSLPVVAILGLLTFQEGLQTSTAAATARSQATAEATAIRIGAWLGERKAELRHIAQDSITHTGKPGVDAVLARPDGSDPAFEAIEIVSTSGKVIAATSGDSDLRDAAVVTITNSLRLEAIQPIPKAGKRLLWMMTEPIVGLDGKTVGVVAGDLNVSALATLLDPYGRATGSKFQEVHVANGAH